MSTYQIVIVQGRLGKDPILRYTQSGTPVCQINLATNESYVDKTTNQKHEQTEWHKVQVWGRQAENVSNYLKKGSLALVEGRNKTRKWTDQQGIDRYVTEVVAKRVIFGPQKQGGNGQNSDQSTKQSTGSAFQNEGMDDEAPF